MHSSSWIRVFFRTRNRFYFVITSRAHIQFVLPDAKEIEVTSNLLAVKCVLLDVSTN
jgi:hypothetical protein